MVHILHLFIAQNKEHMEEMSYPAGGSVCVLLSSRSVEAEGYSEAGQHWQCQHWALRLAQML